MGARLNEPIVWILFLLVNPVFLFGQQAGSARRTQPKEMFLHLSGQIVMEDGTQSGPMVVELYCNGQMLQQIRASADGSFSFDVGSKRLDNWTDAGMGGGTDASFNRGRRTQPGGLGQPNAIPAAGTGQMNLMGCEVRLQVTPEYVAQPIPLGIRSVFDKSDIGTIMVRRLSEEGATTVSLTTLAAPKKAKKAFEKARKELNKKKVNFSSVVKELETAVEVYPEFAAAWELLGRVHMHRGNSDEGRMAFERAVKADPKYINPQIALARIAFESQDWEKAVHWTARLLELDRSNPEALYWDGMANYHLRRIEKAERSLRLLYKNGHSERYPYGLLALGVIHANQGQITEAAQELRSYLELMPADQVPEDQRRQVEDQLQIWESEGLITVIRDQDGS